MKTAIIYATSHGTTTKVANIIVGKLGIENCQIFNIKEEKNIDISKFEQIIIGGSIHAGNIQKSIKDFCKDNIEILLEKRIGLFVCSMYEGENAVKQLENAYSDLLRKHAKSVKILGGEFLLDKMNFFEKLIVKKVAGVKENESKIDEANIALFIDELTQ